jgi:hypothetical protein
MEVRKINHRFGKPPERTQKFPLGPLGLFPSLTKQRILQIQTILASFIEKLVIKIVN